MRFFIYTVKNAFMEVLGRLCAIMGEEETSMGNLIVDWMNRKFNNNELPDRKPTWSFVTAATATFRVASPVPTGHCWLLGWLATHLIRNTHTHRISYALEMRRSLSIACYPSRILLVCVALSAEMISPSESERSQT
jgi:hypothetical protein